MCFNDCYIKIMTALYTFFHIFFTLFLHCFFADNIIELPNGKIRGRIETTRRNITFYAYQEIPFAAPPLGKLRFQPPQPVENWDGILDATKESRVCYRVMTPSDMETEDCLQLNVYTPLAPGTNKSLAVMVYFFGGGFIQGDPLFATYGPHYFMEYDVVIVVPNYRLGPFGFISTGDMVLPGNIGFKDQNFALKWVQNNIHLFGGDPDRVIIFGQSAGGAIAGFHVVSKLSTGLFRGAIQQSGSVISPWSMQRYSVEIAYQTASVIDPTFTKENSSEELFELLQNVPAEVLDEASTNVGVYPGYLSLLQGYVYGPVIEQDHEGAFITEGMYESYLKGDINKVPIFIGTTSEEGIQVAQDKILLPILLFLAERNLQALLPEDFHIENETMREFVAKEARKLYTPGHFLTDWGAAVRFASDNVFNRAQIRQTEMHAEYADAYYYEYSYNSNYGLVNITQEGAGNVGHNRDLDVLWVRNNETVLDDYGEMDVLTSRRLLTLFTNFAKTLNPTPEIDQLLENITVPLVKPGNFQYIDIGEHLEIERDPKNATYHAWKGLYERYGNRPFDTY